MRRTVARHAVRNVLIVGRKSPDLALPLPRGPRAPSASLMQIELIPAFGSPPDVALEHRGKPLPADTLVTACVVTSMASSAITSSVAGPLRTMKHGTARQSDRTAAPACAEAADRRCTSARSRSTWRSIRSAIARFCASRCVSAAPSRRLTDLDRLVPIRCRNMWRMQLTSRPLPASRRRRAAGPGSASGDRRAPSCRSGPSRSGAPRPFSRTRWKSRYRAARTSRLSAGGPHRQVATSRA